MDNLYQLIKIFGNPDALIDHWDTSSNRYAIWEFEETFSINSKGEALLNGKLSHESHLEIFYSLISHLVIRILHNPYFGSENLN